MNQYTKVRLEDMNRAKAANAWLAQGYSPMPVMPGEKSPRYKFAQWLDTLSNRSVDVHWSTHNTDEIALHCGKGLVVLDADSSESLQAMLQLEAKHGLEPKMVVNTKKGVHHYFRQSPELRIKSAGHSTENHPERIDVRCGNGYIIAPPSTGKSLVTPEIVRLEDLSLLTQEFVDELFIHNGDRPLTERPERVAMQDTDEFGEPLDVSAKVAHMRAMLEHIDPDEGYDFWLKALMAIHHETEGSDEGLALADEWSSKGERYKGTRDVEKKWASFDAGSTTPVTMATLASKLKDQGLDWRAICDEAEDPFEPCVMEVVKPITEGKTVQKVARSLKDFSLLGNLDLVRQYAVEATPVLGDLVLRGQFTVFYADGNVGKTLIMLRLLVDAIESKTIDADQVLYVNLDDGAGGLLEKGQIADQYGFHEMAIGYRGFTRDGFFESIKAMISTKEASGTLLILDTLKKFTDVMSKPESSAFGELMRAYTAVGGTVLALAHTNKNPDSNGKPVPGGTSDIPQDADCVYTMAAEDKDGQRVVTFANRKMRGSVPMMAQFTYSRSVGAYAALLDSVRELTVDELTQDFTVTGYVSPEQGHISALENIIGDGFKGKTDLLLQIRNKTGLSRSAAETLLDKFEGDDPEKHRWFTQSGERGVLTYVLHETVDVIDDDPF
jgi:Bifunctional DNA primase/polymerase, N-terminal/Primase C terminal 2 (PriCT-2)/AAA domain